MHEQWVENGPPIHISLAAYVGWKPPSGSGKKSTGISEEYGDLAELEAMFADTGGVIQ